MQLARPGAVSLGLPAARGPRLRLRMLARASGMGSASERGAASVTFRPQATTAQQRSALEETAVFLREELPRLFRTGEIEAARYAEGVEFNDPLVSFNTKQLYSLNIRALTTLFKTDFTLHELHVTGPDQLTARWTLSLRAWALPWRPTLLFTGRSIYRVDPVSGQILSHRDVWDGLRDDRGGPPSPEALLLVTRQLLDLSQTPELDQPAFTTLKAMPDYEVRAYKPFLVAETPLPAGSGPAAGWGFNELAGYIFGGNRDQEKMTMTTPVITTAPPAGASSAAAVMQFPMERKFQGIGDLPAPNDARVSLAELGPSYVAAARVGGLSGLPLDFEVAPAEAALRSALLRDGLSPKPGYRLARYNEPWLPPLLKRNEVLIDLGDFDWP